MRIAATVLLYRPDLAELGRPLEHLRAWSHGPVLVHVNADPDGRLTREVQALLPGASVSGSRENLGFSGGQNRLVERAFAVGADGVVVHNPDLVLEEGAVPALAAAARALGTPALLGPLLELADPLTYVGEGTVDSCGIRWTWSGRHLDDRQGSPLPGSGSAAFLRVAGISGACLLVTRAAFEALVSRTGELFDTDFLAFREDAELGFRAALVGVPSYVVPAARGRHARANRGTTRGRDSAIDRLGVRNRFLIAFKYGRRRPGGLIGPLGRDLVVVLGVLMRERSSLPGLAEAWRLRGRMRAKGRQVLRKAVVSSRQATHPAR
jgi:GT2 family glycosyltransferase